MSTGLVCPERHQSPGELLERNRLGITSMITPLPLARECPRMAGPPGRLAWQVPQSRESCMCHHCA